MVGDVAGVGDGPAARVTDLGGDLLRGASRRRAGTVAPGLAVVVDDDGRTEPAEFERLDTSEPAPRAGDDRGQPFKWQ